MHLFIPPPEKSVLLAGVYDDNDYLFGYILASLQGTGERERERVWDRCLCTYITDVPIYRPFENVAG